MSGATGTDITIVWDPVNARGDWQMNGADLRTGDVLETSVLLSLFTDRIASPDFMLTDGTTDRRGHWSDTYEASPIGSRLWQLDRAKKLGAAALQLTVRDYCVEALQWMVDDGVAAKIDVTTAFLAASAIGVVIVIHKPAGDATTFRYQWAWAERST